MNVRVLPEAEHELLAAAFWYEDRDVGVGVRLLATYGLALERIQSEAESLSRLETSKSNRDIRRLLLHHFPYIVIVEIVAGEAVILAFAHTSQQPNYWIRRRR